MSATLEREVLAEMTRQGLTQADLAKAIGITPQSFSRRIQGKPEFSVRQLVAIANRLNIKPSKLLDRAA